MSTNTKQFEGRTIEEAIAAATSAFGPKVQLLDARKERDGGVLGFFEKERFVLSVAMPDETESSFEKVLDDVQARTDDHQELLQLATEPVTPPEPVQQRPEPTVPAPAPVVHAAAPQPQPQPPLREPLRTLDDLEPAAELQHRAVIDLREASAPRPPVVAALELESMTVQDVTPAPAAASTAVATAATTTETRTPTEPVLYSMDHLDAPQTTVDTAEPVVAHETDGTPQWSLSALQDLGVPQPILQALSMREHENDLAWAAALEETIASLLAELPRTPSATAVGDGLRSAIELLGGVVAGITPQYLIVNGQRVPATATELSLAVRECLR